MGVRNYQNDNFLGRDFSKELSTPLQTQCLQGGFILIINVKEGIMVINSKLIV